MIKLKNKIKVMIETSIIEIINLILICIILGMLGGLILKK